MAIPSEGGGRPMTQAEYDAAQYAAGNTYSTGTADTNYYAWGGAAGGAPPPPGSGYMAQDQTVGYYADPANASYTTTYAPAPAYEVSAEQRSFAPSAVPPPPPPSAQSQQVSSFLSWLQGGGMPTSGSGMVSPVQRASDDTAIGMQRASDEAFRLFDDASRVLFPPPPLPSPGLGMGGPIPTSGYGPADWSGSGGGGGGFDGGGSLEPYPGNPRNTGGTPRVSGSWMDPQTWDGSSGYYTVENNRANMPEEPMPSGAFPDPDAGQRWAPDPSSPTSQENRPTAMPPGFFPPLPVPPGGVPLPIPVPPGGVPPIGGAPIPGGPVGPGGPVMPSNPLPPPIGGPPPAAPAPAPAPAPIPGGPAPSPAPSGGYATPTTQAAPAQGTPLITPTGEVYGTLTTNAQGQTVVKKLPKGKPNRWNIPQLTTTDLRAQMIANGQAGTALPPGITQTVPPGFALPPGFLMPRWAEQTPLPPPLYDRLQPGAPNRGQAPQNQQQGGGGRKKDRR